MRDNHHEVEAILGRLAAPQLSSEGTDRIHRMLDGLSGCQSVRPIPACPQSSPAAAIQSPPPLSRSKAIASAAAAVALTALTFWSQTTSSRHPVASSQPVAGDHPAPSLWLVSESDRLESAESLCDENPTSDLDGSAMQTFRLELLEEDQWFDEETGIVMNVSVPREEIFLMPISAF